MTSRPDSVSMQMQGWVTVRIPNYAWKLNWDVTSSGAGSFIGAQWPSGLLLERCIGVNITAFGRQLTLF